MSEININHRINRIQQPSEFSCWAACLAMMIESGGQKCYSVQGVILHARTNGVTLNPNGSLETSRANMDHLQTAFGIRVLSNRGTVRIADLVPRLTIAPIILMGGFNYADRSSPMNHAVVMGGMWGDGGDDTGLSIVDPQRTAAGTDSSSDDVFSWRDFCTNVVDRLDYVAAIR